MRNWNNARGVQGARNELAVLIILARLVVAIFLQVLAQNASAATLRVGPGEQFTHIAGAARQAKDGDTVEILLGEYRGDVATWNQKALTIRGLGPRPVLIADGKSAED